MASADQGTISIIEDMEVIICADQNIVNEPHNEVIDMVCKDNDKVIENEIILINTGTAITDVLKITTVECIPKVAINQENTLNINSTCTGDKNLSLELCNVDDDDNKCTVNTNTYANPNFNETLDLDHNPSEYIDSVNTIQSDMENIFKEEIQPSKRSAGNINCSKKKILTNLFM